MSTTSDNFPFASIPLQAGLPPVLASQSENLEYYHRQAEIERKERLVHSLLTPEHAERMAVVAQTCLAQGDLQRGVQAIALAVAVDPGRSDWRRILDEYMDAVQCDEETLLPDLAAPWFLFNPLHAYLAMRRGRLSDELDYLTGVVRSFPQRQYLEHWVLPWLNARAMRELGASGVRSIFATLLPRYPEADSITEPQKECLRLVVRQMRRAQRVLGFDEKLHVMQMMALGKLGRFAAAVREAEAAHEANPGWHTAIAAANALRRNGRTLDAISYFRRAARYDRQDVSSLLEIGDAYLDSGKWKMAVAAYERALRRQPKHPWAVPSIIFCRYHLTGDRKLLAQLRRMARSRGDRCGVADFFAGLQGEHGPSSRRFRAEELVARVDTQSASRW